MASAGPARYSQVDVVLTVAAFIVGGPLDLACGVMVLMVGACTLIAGVTASG
jgi:hypothetical protein